MRTWINLLAKYIIIVCALVSASESNMFQSHSIAEISGWAIIFIFCKDGCSSGILQVLLFSFVFQCSGCYNIGNQSQNSKSMVLMEVFVQFFSISVRYAISWIVNNLIKTTIILLNYYFSLWHPHFT